MPEDLMHHCSHLADELFRRRGGDFRTMLWLTQCTDGTVEQFETSCEAPIEIDDATALAALRTEMAADFARDGVVAYAVAYVGRVTFIGVGCAVLARPPSVRRHAIVIEAHGAGAGHVAVRDIIAGVRPRLGALQRSARATGRFDGLLDCARVR
jgi:hypothetical protein